MTFDAEARAQLLADAIELAKRSSASKMIGQRGDFIPPEPKREPQFGIH